MKWSVSERRRRTTSPLFVKPGAPKNKRAVRQPVHESIVLGLLNKFSQEHCKAVFFTTKASGREGELA
jgi:hypothetical protein